MTHAELVLKLNKPGAQILNDLDEYKANLWHMVSGVASEAGELLDCAKKHIIYGKYLDHENLIEELGDLEYFLEGVRQATGITREQCVLHNIDKLTTRYASGVYSNEQAQKRADKI